jgi:hypothetical protein
MGVSVGEGEGDIAIIHSYLPINPPTPFVRRFRPCRVCFIRHALIALGRNGLFQRELRQ